MTNGLSASFTKRYARNVAIEAELEQPADSFSVTVLFGPSGCGKTTLLRCLAGLERPEKGVIRFQDETWFDSERSTFRSPQQRDIGFCFQEFALFPHLTVRQNVGYGLSGRKSHDRTNTVNEMLKRFELSGLGERYPHQLSGGQQQRTAVARSLVRKPRLLLLDEPLSALDTALRDELRSTLRQLLQQFEIPVVLVTHDRVEAISLADRVVVMDAGKVRQRGTVDEVFSYPADTTVARIVGVETVARGHIISVEDGWATIEIPGGRLLAVASSIQTQHVHVCIKGEDVSLARPPEQDSLRPNQLPARVQRIIPEGPLVRVVLDCGFQLVALVTRSTIEGLQLHVGDAVTAAVRTPAIHLLPASPTEANSPTGKVV